MRKVKLKVAGRKQAFRKIEDVEFRVVYSSRRTLGISINPDSSVIVRVPLRTSDGSIETIVRKKYSWIVRHRDNFIKNLNSRLSRKYATGELHLFRGKESALRIEISAVPYINFNNGTIEMGLKDPGDPKTIKDLLYRGYRKEAGKLFPQMLLRVLEKYKNQDFRPTDLVLRTMKRRWGSCTSKGVITLSTELIKLPDIYTEYVITHELCHLKHHNHGSGYYNLLSQLFPNWKQVRKEMKEYTI